MYTIHLFKNSKFAYYQFRRKITDFLDELIEILVFLLKMFTKKKCPY